MNSIFKANPAALLMHEPESIHLQLHDARKTTLSAYRARHSGLFQTCGAGALSGPRYAPLKTGATFRQCLELQAAEGLSLGSAFHVGKAREFLGHQLDAHLNPASPLGVWAQEAYSRFVQAAERLATALHPVLPSHTTGMKISGPHRCYGICSRQAGVFVWPYWRTRGEVHAVVNVRPEQDEAARDVLRDWLAREELRIAPQEHFA